MDVKIRPGTEDDFPAILGLIKELAEFENASGKVTNSVERMKKEQDCFDFHVAELDGEIVGMALYYTVYYTWVGKSMYLDDIYIKQVHRGKGIGTLLLAKVFEAAQKQGCQRLRWQVLDWNVGAIGFYEKIGATIDKEWYNCDFDAEGIRKMKF